MALNPGDQGLSDHVGKKLPRLADFLPETRFSELNPIILVTSTLLEAGKQIKSVESHTGIGSPFIKAERHGAGAIEPSLETPVRSDDERRH